MNQDKLYDLMRQVHCIIQSWKSDPILPEDNAIDCLNELIVLEPEIEKAVAYLNHETSERGMILAYLDLTRDVLKALPPKKTEAVQRRHHIDAMQWAADAIRKEVHLSKEHWEESQREIEAGAKRLTST